MQSKRYAITISHEVIVYGSSQEAAVHLALQTYSCKAKCLKVRELPTPIVEAQHSGLIIIDKRSAPGT